MQLPTGVPPADGPAAQPVNVEATAEIATADGTVGATGEARSLLCMETATTHDDREDLTGVGPRARRPVRPHSAPPPPPGRKRAVNAPIQLREPAAIAKELGALAACSLPQGFGAGARAALEWVTRGGRGPLTGALTAQPPTMRAVVAELSAAESIIYGRPSPLRDFAVGVEHALLWAEFATPTPASMRSMRAQGDCETAAEVGPLESEVDAATTGFR
jgi:hypothetical protein